MTALVFGTIQIPSRGFGQAHTIVQRKDRNILRKTPEPHEAEAATGDSDAPVHPEPPVPPYSRPTTAAAGRDRNGAFITPVPRLCTVAPQEKNVYIRA